jgi:hypothetical protein
MTLKVLIVGSDESNMKVARLLRQSANDTEKRDMATSTLASEPQVIRVIDNMRQLFDEQSGTESQGPEFAFKSGSDANFLRRINRKLQQDDGISLADARRVFRIHGRYFQQIAKAKKRK